jgi:tRNA (mo5U34)-methyltransferase
MDTEAIRSEILRLAPWHLDIEVADGLRTSIFLDEPERPGTSKIEVQVMDAESGAVTRREAYVPEEHAAQAQPHVRLVDARDDFLRTLRSIYPQGLEGRTVLDCGCNAGGYSFWAKEAGAGRCLGFDVREHWIEQATFVASQRGDGGRDMTFTVCDLYDLPSLVLGQFDLVLFNGIFYHLPDPISALKIAADHAKELLILDTATRRAAPSPALEVTEQWQSHATAGIYGLRWLPLGPQPVFQLLHWLGFPEAACTWWRPRSPVRDRIEVVAAREKGTLERLVAGSGDAKQRICSVVDTSVPPGTDVLVASAGDDALLRLSQRRAWHFPLNPDGTWAASLLGDQETLERHLEALAGAGADYLVFPLSLESGLEATPELVGRLQDRYRVVARDPGTCLILYLGEPARPSFDPATLTERR